MSKTLAQLRSQVRSRLGETTEDFWKTVEDIDYSLNEALLRFAAEERWEFYATSVSDTVLADDEYLTLQTNIPSTRQIDLLVTASGDFDSYKPTRVSPSKGFELRAQRTTPTTRPQWFYVDQVTTTGSQEFETVIRFVPPNNVDLDVEYQYTRVPNTLAGAGDLVDVPDEYVEAIVAWATHNCWLKELGSPAKAQEQLGRYREVVEQARNESHKQATGTVLVMGADEPQIKNYGPIGLNVTIDGQLG